MSIHKSQKDRDYLEVFQEVTRLINSVHAPQDVMDLIVRRLPKLMNVDAATIRLYDQGSERFVLGAAFGVSDQYLSRSTIDSKEVMAALMQGTPTTTTKTDLLANQDNYTYIAEEGIQSVLSLPITFKEQIIGLLRLLTKKPRKFDKQEINFAMSLAEQLGIAISNSRLFQEMENQVKFLSELRDISKLVNSTLDLDEILTAIVNTLPGILKVKGCTIRLLHPATNRLELVAASGLSTRYLNRGSIKKENSFFKALKGEPVAIYDAATDPRVEYHDAIRQEGIKSILVVPIKNNNEIIGILRLLSSEHRSFSANEIHFTTTLAEEGGNAIQKARVYRKIQLLFNQIEEHERFLQTILDSLWLQLIVIAPDNSIIMANKKFLTTSGYQETDVLGRSYDSTVPWCHGTGNECNVEKIFKTEHPLTILSTTSDNSTHPDYRCYEHHLAPIFDRSGIVECVIEAVRDITDQKLLEKEKLEKTKLQGVIEMAGTTAHELNSPLFAALGTAQLLQDDLTNEEMKEDMDMIIRNLQKMSELTKTMTAATGFESRDYVGETKIVTLK